MNTQIHNQYFTVWDSKCSDYFKFQHLCPTKVGSNSLRSRESPRWWSRLFASSPLQVFPNNTRPRKEDYIQFWRHVSLPKYDLFMYYLIILHYLIIFFYWGYTFHLWVFVPGLTSLEVQLGSWLCINQWPLVQSVLNTNRVVSAYNNAVVA